MKKTYLSPETELIRLKYEASFCASGEFSTQDRQIDDFEEETLNW